MIWGVLGAVAAAVAYGAASILQSVGVARLAGSRARGRFRAVGPYAAGLVLDLVGFAASIGALRSLPLFFVQSVIASSVGVTALLAVAFLGVRLERREWAALGAIVLGLAALAAAATEGPARPVGSAAQWLLLATAVGCGLGLLIGILRHGERSGALLAVVAGLAFGAVGIAARVLVVPGDWWRMLSEPTLWALIGNAAVAVVAYGFALDRSPVTVVAAITFCIETVVPALIGWAWLGDAVRPGFAAVALIGFLVTLAGCLVLARHAEVSVTA